METNIGNTLEPVPVVYTRLRITPPKVNRFWWNLEHSEYILGGWPWQILVAICTVARTEFGKFPNKGSFRQNLKNLNFINVLWLHAAITLQRLQTDKNLLPNDPSVGSVVSNFTNRINSKSFPWPVHSIQETSPNFLQRRTTADGTTQHINLILVTHSLSQAVTKWRSTTESHDIRPWILGRVECTK